MNTPTTVTAVIPAYNSAASIARALDSVLAQSTPVDEVILVDDGSTDDTRAVVQAFGNAVRYIRQDNAGSSAARNTGIEAASGQWIAFLDADDAWKREKNEIQLDMLRQYPDLAWIAGAYDNYQRGELKFTCNHPYGEGFGDSAVVEDALQFIAARGSIWTGTVFVRRDIFDEVGNFDVQQRTSHDLDLWLRIGARHPRLGWVSEPIAEYELNNPSGLTSTSVLGGDETLVVLYDRALQLCSELPASRSEYLQSFVQAHATALLRDFVHRGRRDRTRWLLAQLKHLNIRIPIWLELATHMSPTILQPIQASVSYTRSVLGAR